MKLLPLAFLLISIYIEHYASNYSSNALNPFCNFMLGTIFYFYLNRPLSTTKICLIYIWSSSLSYLADYFIHNNKSDFPILSVILVNIYGVGWAMSTNQQDVNQLSKSYFFTNLIENCFENFHKINIIFWYCKNYLISTIDSFNDGININSMLLSSAVLLVKSFGTSLTICGVNMIMEKFEKTLKKDKNRITHSKIFTKSVIRAFIFSFISIALFYVNYNTSLANYSYELLMTKVDAPNNIIIYNSVPLDPDSRFKILLLVEYYCYKRISEYANSSLDE